MGKTGGGGGDWGVWGVKGKTGRWKGDWGRVGVTGWREGKEAGGDMVVGGLGESTVGKVRRLENILVQPISVFTSS